jgi:putative transposase
LPTNVALADYMQKLKGESSHWINQNKLLGCHFNWGRGFGAYSVSASLLNTIKKYIENQKEHHVKSTFTQEYEEWKKKYGIFDDKSPLEVD